MLHRNPTTENLRADNRALSEWLQAHEKDPDPAIAVLRITAREMLDANRALLLARQGLNFPQLRRFAKERA